MPSMALNVADGQLGWRDLKFFRDKKHEKILQVLKHHSFLPNEEDIFKALILTPRHKTRVVILGQDPYPGYDPELQIAHACGLAFSVDPRIKLFPPSLRNILQELQTDMGYSYPKCGDLTQWAKQGVLLLNTCLTIQPGKVLSHQYIGWSELTLEIIRSLDDCVWILWGRHAQNYESEINNPRLIIKSSHPSSWSANKGFFGSAPFSKANEALDVPIRWELK